MYFEGIIITIFFFLLILFFTTLAFHKMAARTRRIAVIVVMLFFALMFPTLLFAISSWTIVPSPPKPKIKKAEFPFTLEYYSNEELVTIESTMTCKYAGIRYSGTEKGRLWTANYSRNNPVTLYNDENAQTVYTEDGEIVEEKGCHVHIYLYPGEAGYYMGDEKWEIPEYPYVYCEVKKDGIRLFRESIYGTDIYDSPLLAMYGIKITKWEIADPIENSFS